jgi:general secretion pathway protein J
MRLRRSRGFTILELLVAVALLAVLALLSWRGMGSVIAGRDSIVERSDELRALTVVMSQMEEDLRRSWAVRLLGLSVPPVGFSMGNDREPPSLTVLREAPGEDTTQIQRVVWRLRDGTIERGFSAWTVPIPGVTNPVPDIPFTWQPVVRGIEALELRGWLEGRGWLPAASLAASQASEMAAEAARAEQLARAAQIGQPAQPGTPGQTPPGQAPQAGATTPAANSVLVTGVEMVLVRRGERIVRVFAVAD